MFCSETDFSFSPLPTPSTSAKMPVAPHHTVDVDHREKDLVDKKFSDSMSSLFTEEPKTKRV
jgi:hypothetical protein